MPFIKTDRFGQSFQSIFCRNNKNGYPVGYVELGSKLYKVEPGQVSENRKGESGTWCKITAVKKRTQSTKM